MADLTIKTNNQGRELVTFNDLPEKVKSDFDYVEEMDRGDYRFFKYKGVWYDVHEFVRIVETGKYSGWGHGVEAGSPLLAWHRIHVDSMFSGIVIRFANEVDCTVIPGTVLS